MGIELNQVMYRVNSSMRNTHREKGGRKMKNMPSLETQQAMADFFMRTSVPRILEERELEELEKNEKESIDKILNKHSHRG